MVTAAASLTIERLSDTRFRVADPQGSGEPHVVVWHDHGPTCDCKSFEHRHRCKHVNAVGDVVASARITRPQLVKERDTDVPWSNDAEQAVLGALLLDPAAATDAARIVDPSMFYREAHRLLFRAVVSVAARGCAIDPVTVRDELLQRGDLDRAGGMEYLASLIDVVPTAANVAHHARIVAEKAARRRLIELGARARNGTSAADLAASAAEVIAQLTTVTDVAAGSVVRSLADFIRDPDAMRPPAAVIPRLAWRGRLTMLASSEGWGKSTHAKAGAAAVTVGQAFMDGEAAPPADVVWARLEESEYDTMMGARRFGADPSRFFVWTPGLAPVADLIAVIRERRPALTVVDSIQELAVLAGVENLDDAGQMGRALLSLVHAGRELNTAMLWLSQGAKATGRYRNSSWLGHIADAVFEIKAPEPDSSIRELTVPKRRMDVFEYRVELVDERYQLAGGADGASRPSTAGLSRSERAALEALAAVAIGERGATTAEWLDASQECRDSRSQIGRGTFFRARKRLVDLALVRWDQKSKRYSLTGTEIGPCSPKSQLSPNSVPWDLSSREVPRGGP